MATIRLTTATEFYDLDLVTGALEKAGDYFGTLVNHPGSGTPFALDITFGASGDLFVLSEIVGQTGRRVLTYDDATGTMEDVATISGQPNGFGTLPDGRMLMSDGFNGSIIRADLRNLPSVSGIVLAGAQGFASAGDVVFHEGGIVEAAVFDPGAFGSLEFFDLNGAHVGSVASDLSQMFGLESLGRNNLIASEGASIYRIDDETGEATLLFDLSGDIAGDINGLAFAGPANLDRLFGGTESDRLSGFAGDDVIFGFGAADILRGGGGEDFMDGGADGDDMSGGNGADTMRGAGGADLLRGGAAGDLILGGGGADRILGGGGGDRLLGGNGGDLILGGGGADEIEGGGGGDRLRGGAAGDLILGGGGRDDIRGGAGADEIDGGGGADVISGNSGGDVLTGGRGRDLFRFTAGDGAQTSRITDFEDGTDHLRFVAPGGVGFDELSATQFGRDLLIEFDGVGVLVKGLAMADFSQDDLM